MTYAAMWSAQLSTRVVLAASLNPDTPAKEALAAGEPWSAECAVVGGNYKLLQGKGNGAAIDAHAVVLRVVHGESTQQEAQQVHASSPRPWLFIVAAPPKTRRKRTLNEQSYALLRTTSGSGTLMGWYRGGSQLSEHDSGVRTSLVVLDSSAAESCMAHDAADCAQCSFHGATTPIMADYGARLGGGSFRGERGSSTIGSFARARVKT